MMMIMMIMLLIMMMIMMMIKMMIKMIVIRMMMMMFQVSPSPECLAAVKRMRTCSACKGLPDLQPCPGLCLNTMKGCLAYHYEIDDLWNKYIGKYTLHH